MVFTVFAAANAPVSAAGPVSSGPRMIASSVALPVASGKATIIGSYAPTTTLRVVLGLQPPHMAAEEAFLAQIQDRHSSLYHHFLTAQQWNDRFAPTAAQQAQVVNWVKSQGLTVTHTYADRLLVDTTGTVGAFEHAFNVKINTYRAAPSVTGPRTFFANDRPVTLPAAISAAVESVNGLDNFRVMQSNASIGLHGVSANATAANAPVYSAGNVVASSGGAHANATGHVLASLKAGTLHPNLTSGLIDPRDLWGSNGYNEGPLYALGHCCDPDGTVNDSSRVASIAISTAGSFDNNDLNTYASHYGLAYHWVGWNIDGTPGLL